MSPRWLLDANIVAELMRPAPDRRVVAFLDQIEVGSLAISTVTVWEILNGLGRMPVGKRRRDLTERYLMFERDLFGDWVLPWTHDDAGVCAQILEVRRRAGRPLDDQLPDAFLAAVAVTRNLRILTRNTRDFEGTGALAVDPWVAP